MLPFLRLGSKKQMQKSNNIIVTRFMVMRNNVMDYATYNGNLQYPGQYPQEFQNQCSEPNVDDSHRLPSITITNNSMNYYNGYQYPEDESNKQTEVEQNNDKMEKEEQLKVKLMTSNESKLTTISEGSEAYKSQLSEEEYEYIENYEGSDLTSTNGSSFMKSSSISSSSSNYNKTKSKSSKKSKGKDNNLQSLGVSVGIQTVSPQSDIDSMPDQEKRLKLLAEVFSESELEQRRKLGNDKVNLFDNENGDGKKNGCKNGSDSDITESSYESETNKTKKINKKKNGKSKEVDTSSKDNLSKKKNTLKKTKLGNKKDSSSNENENNNKSKPKINKVAKKTKKGKSDNTKPTEHHNHRHHHTCILDPNIPLTEAQRKIIANHIKHHHQQHLKNQLDKINEERKKNNENL